MDHYAVAYFDYFWRLLCTSCVNPDGSYVTVAASGNLGPEDATKFANAAVVHEYERHRTDRETM